MIAVVEDEKELCESLKLLLIDKGYEIVTAGSCGEADKFIGNPQIDMFLLDVKLPDGSGFDICRKIRKSSEVPVIFLTSCDNEEEIVTGLDIGADDYITKPYNPTILLLRIAAVLKRMEGSQNTASYRDAEVNFSKGTISKGDQEMVLTKNEMIIFQLLLANREKIVSRDEIMTDLWDNDEFVNDNALTVNISRLRGKLADLGYDDAIETRKKQGYRLV